MSHSCQPANSVEQLKISSTHSHKHTEVNSGEREVLPVQLVGKESSPVLKSCAAAVSSDDRDHGSLTGKSLCTENISPYLKMPVSLTSAEQQQALASNLT